MLIRNGVLQLSGSDLVGHLNCRHLTGLEFAAARGDLKKDFRLDPLLQILMELGLQLEKSY